MIFRQERVGQGGKLFTLFKFRTMEVTSEQDGPSLTRSGDPRITKFGRFLRKYKLDELPQLINVLRGEMSLIGPRPKVPHLEVMEMPFRPGLTGAATLAFRCEEEMLQDIPAHELEAYYCRAIQPLKAKLDREYMRQATFVSDLSIALPDSDCLHLPPAQPMVTRGSVVIGALTAMTVSERDVERVAELANLELTADEKSRMLHDLNSILDYVAQLNQLDTASVPPMAQVAEHLTNGRPRTRPRDSPLQH